MQNKTPSHTSHFLSGNAAASRNAAARCIMPISAVVAAGLAACSDEATAPPLDDVPYAAINHVLTVDRDALLAYARAELAAEFPEADTSGQPQVLFYDQYSQGVESAYDWNMLFVTWELPEAHHIIYDVEGFGTKRSTAVGARLLLNGLGPQSLDSVMRVSTFTFTDEGIPPLTTYDFTETGLVTFGDGVAEEAMNEVLETAAAAHPGLTYTLSPLAGVASIGTGHAMLADVLRHFRQQAGVMAAELDAEFYAGVFFASPVQVVDASAPAIDLTAYMTNTGAARESLIFDTAPTLIAPFGPGPISGIGEGLIGGDAPNADAANGYVATIADGFESGRCLATARAQFPELTMSARADESLRINGTSQRAVYEAIATILAYPCVASVRAAGKQE